MNKEKNTPPGYCLLQLIKDQNGHITDHFLLEANPAFEELTGIKCDHLDGKSAQKFIHFIEPDLYDMIHPSDIPTEACEFEFYSKVKNCCLHVQVIPLKTENRILAVFSNAGEQKEVEKSLLENEYLEIINSSSVGSFYHDLEKGEIYYSNEWKKRLGIEHLTARESVIASNSCVHPDDCSAMQKIFMKACENKEPKVQMEFRAKTKDSGYIWILGQAKIIYNREGKPIKYFGTHMDISERKYRELNTVFLAEMGDKLALLPTVKELVQFAGEKIKCYFHVDCVLFAEVNQNKKLRLIDPENRDLALDNELNHGGGNAIYIVSTDSGLKAYSETFESQDIRSRAFSSFIGNHNARYFLVLHNYLPRRWRKDETELLERLSLCIYWHIERIRYEEKIKFQAHLLSNVQEAIAAFDENMRIIYWNEVSEKLYGWTAEEALGSYTKDLFHTEIPGSSREKVHAKMLSDGSFSGEVIYYHKDGRPVHTDVHTKVIKGPDGEFKGGVTSFRDISDCKKVLEALQKNESLLHSIIEGTTDPIFLKDRQSRIVLANSATAKATGLTVKSIIGKTTTEYIHDKELADRITENDNKTIESDNSLVFEEIITSPYGRRTYLSTKTPWRDQSGNILGLICVGRDITDRKEMEEKLRSIAEELKHKNRVVTEFFTNISHELKTPLALILNQLELIRLFPDDSQKIQEFIDIAIKNSFRLTRLINNLLDITKIDAGFIRAHYTYSDVVSLIRELCSSVESYAASKSIQLNFITDLTEKIMPIDTEKMERILLNLLSNAMKFTGEGGKINVKIEEKKGGELVLIVEDTGEGIPEEYHDVIFNRFIQIHTSLQRNTEGCGIGLALVKSLVEILKGSIRLESQVGVGSRFIIDLPFVDLPIQTEHTLLGHFNLSINTAVEFSELS